MKITISGRPGAGKSVLTEKLAACDGFQIYSVGKIMRDIAKERGISIEEFMHVIDEKTERDIDEMTRNFGTQNDNFVFDSRLAFHFIEDSFKIFLTVAPDIGAKRIFSDPRKGERKASSVEDVAANIKDRWETDKKRYQERYKIDVDNPENYDLVLDTSHLTQEETYDRIKKAIQY